MSCNGTEVDTGSLDIKIPYKSGINFIEWMENYNKSVNESADFLDSLIADKKSGKDIKGKILGESKDSIYDWLDSYFALPEEADMRGGGREVVPLLIGPTAVFKSATVKELCAKYNYRMVDFRVAFTSRLDYSGLYQMGEIDGSKFSYSCPMEELVTCSDGFRAFCRKALDKVKKILSDGYMEDNKVSDGENQDSNQVQLTSEQIEKLNKLVQSYEYYLRTPVLFMDEITRCRDEGVNGVLVQLLNQKRFNDMTMNGCKFVAATNLNISRDRDHLEYSDELQDMYDVQVEIDVAYANRFMPLLVQPKDVEGRWFEWAEGTKEKNGKTVTSIHQIVLDFLKGEGSDLVYNDQPVIDAIKEGLSDNEKRAQTFPNYRTWEMLSDYMYSIDEDYEVRLKDDADAKREYRSHIIEGLISKWAGKRFIKYIKDHDYYEYDSVHGQVADDVGDFLSSTLSAGVPALLIGPSSLGKTSRVHAYMKDVERRTGLKPILINVNLASCDTTDLMGYPIKKSLVEYSAGNDFEKLGLGSVQKDLQSIMSGVQSNLDYGMTDFVTLRAPDMRMKERFKRALDEGREVILFFDEANRVKNPTIMSAIFECISDSRIFGISFKNQKDKVKIVAACNMSYQGMEDGEDIEGDAYSSAGSLDPALAARFSMYWKKGYDENDVKSWIAFMEDQKKEGNIDSTLVDYFKTLSTDEAIKTMARVEARTLESAEPSTRTFFQMSKDIKSMRGKIGKDGFKKSLYNGKIVFDSIIEQEYIKVVTDFDNQNMGTTYLIQETVDFLKKITEYKDNWEASITGEKIDVGGNRILSGEDIMDTLDKIREVLGGFLIKPMTSEDMDTCKAYVSTAIDLASAVQKIDQRISDKRKDWFSMYVGEEFASRFVTYFNSVYGTEMDEDITIEMLSDASLINPFLRKKRIELSKLSGDTDKMVDEMLDLMREFLSVHGTTLPSKNYSVFIDGVRNVLPVADNMSTLLIRSDKTVEDMFRMAEGQGDSWIKGIISCYSANISDKDIDDMRDRMSQSVAIKSPKRRSRIL